MEEYRLKQQIKKQFGTYLSPDMVEKLQKDPDLLKLGGETRELSIMFTDVRGFTTISEHYGEDVQGLTKIMNRYMTAMSESILENHGTIDKYIGDAQMAFWNAPLDDLDHAYKSVDTALNMMKRLETFNDEISNEQIPPFGMGIGINTGSVVVGNMGSDLRFDYTCLGDTVNLAARLEGQTKNYSVDIILGEETVKRRSEYPGLDGLNDCIELDRIVVKGKTKPVVIYTVLDKKYDTGFHENFLERYRAQDWPNARQYAIELRYDFDEKLLGYYEMMISRIQNYRNSDLPENWGGEFVSTTK
jgi:adenylate cyclase